MTFGDIEEMFRQMTCLILGYDPDLNHPDNEKIKISYPTDGAPGFKIDQDIVFIRLFEVDDDYSRQRDITYKYDPVQDTVFKIASRTRVWETFFIVYGPNSYSIANKIKDGVFRQKIKNFTASKQFFLLPELRPLRRAPELYSGQWWERSDLAIRWNELYYAEPEDVGYIKKVPLTAFTETIKKEEEIK